MLLVFTTCGRSSLVERQLPKLKRGVRFPSPAPQRFTRLHKQPFFIFFKKKLALYFSIWYSISCSRRVGQVVKTPPSHGGFKGSNPLRVTTHIIARSKASGFFVVFEGRFLFSIKSTQNLHILFSKHIYGEYPLHLYTVF